MSVLTSNAQVMGVFHIDDKRYAIPLHLVDGIVSPDEIKWVGRQAFVPFEEKNIRLYGWDKAIDKQHLRPLNIVSTTLKKAIAVDDFESKSIALDHVQALPKVMQHSRSVINNFYYAHGDIIFIINPAQLAAYLESQHEQ